MRHMGHFIIAAISLSLVSFPLPSEAQEQELVITRENFQVAAGTHTRTAFKLNTYVRNGRIAGSAQASGGTTGDIRVLIFTEDQYLTWTKGQRARVLYDSGRRRSVVLSVPVTSPGTYYVVFDNSFAIVAAKTVSADIRLIHGGEDVGRAEEVKRQVSERERRVGQIIQRLVEALQAAEKKWGTRQVSPPVYFQIADDPSINAFSYWKPPIILVNRGLLEFAESMPTAQMRDDTLAGVLAHELGHIFYRHSRGKEQEQLGEAVIAGGAGAMMVNPLVGLAVGLLSYDRHRQYDRMEEKDADILGIRLSCVAGFNPAGLLTFMTKVREQNPSLSGFLQSHPAPAERIEYLQKELQSRPCPRLSQAEPPITCPPGTYWMGKGCTSRPSSEVERPKQQPPLTQETIASLTYRINDRAVRLTNGRFDSGKPPVDPEHLTVAVERAVFGDLDGDGSDDAAVILVWSGGGSGFFYELAAVANRKPSPIHLTSADLGDRVVIKAVTIQSGRIIVEMLEHAPTDPACCPTKKTVRTYVLSGNTLVRR